MSAAVEAMPVSPADVHAAQQAVAYVSSAVAELSGIEQDLPGLVRMEWRSPAASQFEEVFAQDIKHVSATLRDLRDCAAAVERHAEELRSLGCEVQ